MRLNLSTHWKLLAGFVFAALLGTQGLNAQCTPTFKLDTIGSCEFTVTIKMPNTCGAGAYAEIVLDGGTKIPMAPGSKVVLGTAGFPLKPGNHVFTWKATNNGTVTTGSKTVLYPGAAKQHSVDCSTAKVELYHYPTSPLTPYDTLCNVGFKITKPLQYQTCSPITKTVAVFKNANLPPAGILVTFPVGENVLYTKTTIIPPGTYNIEIVTTFFTNISPSVQTQKVSCPMGIFILPGSGVTQPSCNTASLSVVNCQWKITEKDVQPFANCTYVNTRSVRLTGGGLDVFDANVIGDFVYPGIFDNDLQPNTTYTVTTVYYMNNGTIKTCVQTIKTPPSTLQVDCASGGIGFSAPTTNPCLPNMWFKMPNMSCENFEWQAGKVFNASGVLVWMAMAQQPGMTLTWNLMDANGNPVPAGFYNVMLVTSVYPIDPATGEAYKISCNYTIYIPPVGCCNDNTLPNILCVPLQGVSTNCNQPVVVNIPGISASDNCPSAVLTYFTTVKLELGTQIKYAGATNGINGLVLTPGVYVITWQVGDGNGNTSICTQSLSITSNNTPMTIQCGIPVVVQLDECSHGIYVPYPSVSGGCGSPIANVTTQILSGTTVIWQSGVLPGGVTSSALSPNLHYTIKVIATNQAGQTATCSSGPYLVPQVEPFTKITCPTVTVDCDGAMHFCPPDVTNHCPETQAFIACWTPTLYTPLPTWDLCLKGDECATIPAGEITANGTYPLEITVLTLSGQTLSCTTNVQITNLQPNCNDTVPPVWEGCICLPDTIPSCSPVQIVYDPSHLAFTDNFDPYNQLIITTTVLQVGVIAPIDTVTNGVLTVWLAPGTYTYITTATDLNGNTSQVSHTMVVDCPNAKPGGGNTFNLVIAPNPASDQVTIALGDNISADVTIMTSAGEVVEQASITAKGDIDVSQLPSGMYYITARTAESATTKRIVVVR